MLNLLSIQVKIVIGVMGGDGKGKNMLGITLMNVRKQLMEGK